jgi:hypothetical protein
MNMKNQDGFTARINQQAMKDISLGISLNFKTKTKPG